MSLDDSATMIRRLLEDAVSKRLVADVPLGAFLSGGIDSSAVVACMARLTADPVRTFTIGFDDTDGFDERRYASLVARSFGTEHTEFVVHPDMVDLVDQLAWHFDQPFADSSALPTYLLSEQTKSAVTVALCGDGGDEVFAGYERFSAAMAVDRWTQVPSSIRRVARRAADAAPGPLRGPARKASRFMARADAGMPDALRAWISYIPEDQLQHLVPGASRWALDDYRAVWASSAGAPRLDRILDLNARTYLLDDLLPKVDRTSMAHGLEVRTPFLDRDLVGAALRLPPTTRLRGLDRKRVLKRAFRGVLPTRSSTGPSAGSGCPSIAGSETTWPASSRRASAPRPSCAPTSTAPPSTACWPSTPPERPTARPSGRCSCSSSSWRRNDDRVPPRRACDLPDGRHPHRRRRSVPGPRVRRTLGGTRHRRPPPHLRTVGSARCLAAAVAGGRRALDAHPFGPLGPTGGLRRVLAGAIAVRDAALVHARSDLAAAATMLARRRHWIWDVRSFWADELIELGRLRAGSAEERVLRYVERSAARRCGGAVTLAAAAIPVLAERHGPAIAERTRVITTCVDLGRFPLEPLPSGALRFVLSGTLNAAYDVPAMLALVARAAERRPTELLALVPGASPWEHELAAAGAKRERATPAEMPGHLRDCHVGLSVWRTDMGITLTRPCPPSWASCSPPVDPWSSTRASATWTTSSSSIAAA